MASYIWPPLSGGSGTSITIGSPANGLNLTGGGVLTIGLAGTSTTGALSSTDWNTFNNKQATLTPGNISTSTTGVSIGSGTSSTVGPNVTVNVQAASGSQPGLLLAADWTTFNSKQSALTFGSISTSTTGVSVGSGTNSTVGPAVTVNVQTASGSQPGLLSAADWTTFNGKQASGSYILANGTIPFTADQSLGSHKLTNVTDPVSAQDAATKNYVDTALAGLQPQDAVYAATTTNIAGTYLNGVAGVGATFTTTATGTFTVDGVTPPLGARILIKNQSSGFQNGVYSITTLGVVSVSTVFTRTLDYDTASDMNSAGLIPVINGTLNALSSWQQVATITTVGTDALVFTEFTANPSLYLLKANNLSDVATKATSFNNLSPMTTAGDIIVGGTSGAGIRLGIGSTSQVLTVVSGAPAWAPSSSSYSYSAQAANYTLLTTDQTVQFNCSTGSLTATLFSAASAVVGQPYTITRFLDATPANRLTINTTSAQTVGGRASGSIKFQPGDFMTVISDGTNWQIADIQETVSMRARISGGASTATSGNALGFATLDWDTHSAFASNTTFTCPTAGYYRMMTTGLSGNANNNGVAVFKNTVLDTAGFTVAQTTAGSSSFLVSCAAGDTLYLGANGGTTSYANNSSNCWVSIDKL